VLKGVAIPFPSLDEMDGIQRWARGTTWHNAPSFNPLEVGLQFSLRGKCRNPILLGEAQWG